MPKYNWENVLVWMGSKEHILECMEFIPLVVPLVPHRTMKIGDSSITFKEQRKWAFMVTIRLKDGRRHHLAMPTLQQIVDILVEVFPEIARTPRPDGDWI